MNITFIGIGNVGSALANNLAKLGHTVFIAARDPRSESVRAALTLNTRLRALPVAEAVKKAEVVFLATPYAANADALKSASGLSGKVLVDCTNPVGPGVTHGLQSRTSGAEEVQRLAPGATVVKAFTIYGYENFQNPSYPGYDVKPAMLIAGDDGKAKATVARLCEELGWRPVDVGPLSSSLHLEHMTLLWIKMARVQGQGANFVWAMLER